MTSDSSYTNFINNIQQDVNYLRSDQKQTRIHALKKIEAAISKTDKQVLESLLREPESEFKLNIITLFSDPLDICRELSIRLVNSIVLRVPEVTTAIWMPLIIPVALHRLCNLSETKEEVKLPFLELIHSLICHYYPSTDSKPTQLVADIVRILKTTLMDPYDELKKESCFCISALIEHVPDDCVRLSTPTLIAPLISNVTHHKHPIRQASLEAIRLLVLRGAETQLEVILPQLTPLTSDKSNKVRDSLLHTVADWLILLPPNDRKRCRASLLGLLLTGLHDSLPVIQELTLQLLSHVGELYMQEKGIQEFQDVDFPNGKGTSVVGITKLTTACLPELVPSVLHDLTDWTVKNRARASQTLQSILLYAETTSSDYVPPILEALYIACNDEDSSVRNTVFECAKLLGHFVSPSIYLPLMLPVIRGDSLSSSLHRTAVVSLLSSIVAGTSTDQLSTCASSIIECISTPDVVQDHFEKEYFNMHIEVLTLLHHMVSKLKSNCHAVLQQLLSLLLRMRTVPVLQLKSTEVLTQLAAAVGISNEELFDYFLPQLVTNSNCEHYTNDSTEVRLLEIVLPNSTPSVVAQHLDSVLSIFVSLVNKKREPALRSRILSLLHQLLSNSALETVIPFWNPRVSMIVNDIVLPSMVWQSGRATQIVRKEAIHCLHKLVALQEKSNAFHFTASLRSSLNEMVTVLLSSLEEDDAISRCTMCRVIETLLVVFQSDWTAQQMSVIHPALTKRLNDSDDAVRIAAAAALQVYVTLPREDANSKLESYGFASIVSNLLIHLDDSNPAVQRAMLVALEQYCRVAPQVVVNAVGTIRSHHRSEMCDKLLESIQQQR